MAVTQQFEEDWLECQDKYGKNIEAGDIEALSINEVDESVSLPAVRFTAPYVAGGSNEFRDYVHVPMKTLKKSIDDLAAQVSTATDGLTTLKQQTIAATSNANTAAQAAQDAADEANQAAGRIGQEADEESVRDIVRNWTPSV